jgi:hypothetical protein
MGRKIIIIVLLFMLMPASLLFEDTYAHWGNPDNAEYQCSNAVELGIWRNIPILEKVKIINYPRACDEFIYRNELYVVIKDGVPTINDSPEWWANNYPGNSVNMVSPVWVRNNYYDQTFLPVNHNQTAWLAYNSGASGQEPGISASWFKISDDYLPVNCYPEGYIIQYGENSLGPRYWIATRKIQPHNFPDTQNSGWQEIMPWVSGTSYRKEEILYTRDAEGIHFWRALKNTGTAPSVTTATYGEYWEIKNAWIRSENASVENYWVEHNVYRKDEIVVYGSDNCPRFRYFICVKNNITGIEPFSLINEEERINTEYWQEIR